MAQFQLLLLCLILADAYVCVTMADEEVQTKLQPSPAPSPSPSNSRKLGKHQLSKSKSFVNAPALSPSSAPASTNEVPAESEENVSILEQQIHLKRHHHSMDKSVAGGGVILGGLATTFLVAVFCYIRATARPKTAETTGAQISS